MMKLDQHLADIRRARMTFEEGIGSAKEFVVSRGGSCEEKTVDGTKFYILTLGKDEAFCFQPYPDIDRFYYES